MTAPAQIGVPVSHDPVEHLAELREELDVDAQRFERARDRVGSVEAVDESGTVRVRTDPHGLVEAVTVDGGWQGRLAASELAAAVLEAYGLAGMAQGQTWAEAFDGEEPLRPRPAPPLHSTSAGQLRERLEELREHPAAATLMSRLADLLHELDARVDAALARSDRLAGQDYAGRSSSRHVRARVAFAGTLVGLEYDERWLAGAHAFNIGRETVEAVHDALASLASAQTADPDPLADLAALAEDPTAFAAFLGVPG